MRLAKAGGATREVYSELADLGLTGLAVPPDHGGMGFGAGRGDGGHGGTGPRPGQRALCPCGAARAGPAGRGAAGAAGRLAAEASPTAGAWCVPALQERAARYR